MRNTNVISLYRYYREGISEGMRRSNYKTYNLRVETSSVRSLDNGMIEIVQVALILVL